MQQQQAATTLDELRAGQSGLVLGTRLADGEATHLGSLGVLPRRVLRMSRCGGGACIIDVRSERGPWHRVALSRAVAKHVLIVPMAAAATTAAGG